jgi:hypothetical protein
MLWAIQGAHARRVDPVQASRARWLAVEKLEDVIADRHSASRGYVYLDAANYPTETELVDFQGFQREVRFAETTADLSNPSAGGGFMTVTVRVTWNNTKGEAMDLEVSTVLTAYPTS